MNKHHITLEMALDDAEICQQLDIIQALDVLAEEISTSDELVNKIKSLFSDKKMKGVSLSTIHKAKGLESDNVFICCPSLLPANSAKEIWELQQEANLEYVAYTRAKKTLSFLDEKEFSNYSPNSQQRSSDLKRIMERIFEIYGGNERCRLEKPSLEAAKRILSNKTEILEKPKNAIDLGKNGNQPRKNDFIVSRKKRKR